MLGYKGYDSSLEVKLTKSKAEVLPLLNNKTNKQA